MDYKFQFPEESNVYKHFLMVEIIGSHFVQGTTMGQLTAGVWLFSISRNALSNFFVPFVLRCFLVTGHL